MSGLKALSHIIITLFLCGDVMTGRGIDQVLPHPGNPRLYEPWVEDSRRYVELAERAHGPIHYPVNFSYPWGDALGELERAAPDMRLINLETAITSSPDFWPGKGIHYRMHPANIPALAAAGIDVCVLANNHVLDWGYAGLEETLETLRKVGIAYAGAGSTLTDAQAPAVIQVPGKGRVLVFAFGSSCSGIPVEWAAAKRKSGINLLADLTPKTISAIGQRIRAVKRTGDIVVVSLHWGGNWGFEITRAQREFAHRLIDEAGVDIIHGHSSHHVKGIEVYRGKPVLYGCGDFLTDYEGISGYEKFRGDLGLMYFVSMNPSTGILETLHMIPTQVRNFRIRRASVSDTRWIADTLNREGTAVGTRIDLAKDLTLHLRWDVGGRKK
jgi:poly-gamma-glutamate synthesis protein (capsule biosynthesis protein)